MTSQEILDFVRMTLDDGTFQLPGLAEALAAVNEAQRLKIHEYHAGGEERALRPLYRESGFLDSGDTLNGVLYPRGCRLYESDAAPDAIALDLSHVNHDAFLHFAGPGHGSGADAERSPSGQYSVYNNQVYFKKTATAQRVKLWYITDPAAFTTTQTLAVPPEFHGEIAIRAAVLLNEIDENEQERTILG